MMRRATHHPTIDAQDDPHLNFPRRRVQGPSEEQLPGRGREDLQGHHAGGTEEEVPAGGKDPEAVRTS